MRVLSFAAATLACALSFGGEGSSVEDRLAADLFDALNMEPQIRQDLEKMVRAGLFARQPEPDKKAAKKPDDADAAEVGATKPKGVNMFAAAALGGEMPRKVLIRRESDQAEKLVDKTLECFSEEMKAGELGVEYIKVLSQTFTIEELKELNAFFRSPAGKAFVKKQPELALQFMETSQRSLRGLLPKAAAKARDAAGGEEKKKAEAESQ